MKRFPLSVTIITYNEEDQIEKCIQSVDFADEIIVVDSGSSDNTVEIAKKKGALVTHQPWLGYGKQKETATKLASHSWILSIDADEYVSQTLKTSILQVLENPQKFAYLISRKNRFMNRWLNYGEGYPDWILRLFHKDKACWSPDCVHEKVITTTPLGRLKGDLMHHSEHSLHQYLEKQNRYTTLQAQQMHLAGKKASSTRLLVSPLLRFIKMYFLKRGFLDGLPGLLHILIGCQNSFQKYAKLKSLNTPPSLEE